MEHGLRKGECSAQQDCLITLIGGVDKSAVPFTLSVLVANLVVLKSKLVVYWLSRDAQCRTGGLDDETYALPFP